MGFPNFRTIAKYLAPSWLTTGQGELVTYSLDLMRDAFVERVRLGLLTRFPQRPNGGTTPPDALVAIGKDRRVVRGLNETDASYAARTLAWLDDRRTCGNPFTLMQKIGEYIGAGNPLASGCMMRTVDDAGNWFTIDAAGNRSFKIAQANWDWDKDLGLKWSRFWVIIYPPATLWTPNPNWADTSGPNWTYTGLAHLAEYTWGSTATSDEVQSIRAIVADWKPAGTTCVNIVIAFDPASFSPLAAVDSTGMPDGLWTHWSKYVGGVQVPARLSTARYWDGV